MSDPDARLARGDEDALFRAYAVRLREVVGRRVFASDTQLDDACATAWLAFLRAQPRRETAFTWLVVVAVREAWRLTAADREQAPLALGDHPLDTPAEEREIDLALLARERLRAVAEALPQRKRRVLALKAVGYSYEEIARITGDTTTTVNRQLARAYRLLDPLRVPLDA